MNTSPQFPIRNPPVHVGYPTLVVDLPPDVEPESNLRTYAAEGIAVIKLSAIVHVEVNRR